LLSVNESDALPAQVLFGFVAVSGLVRFEEFQFQPSLGRPSTAPEFLVWSLFVLSAKVAPESVFDMSAHG
jgi:hypothetical protein